MSKHLRACAAVLVAACATAGAANAAKPVDGVKVTVPGQTKVVFLEYNDAPGSPEQFVGLTFAPISFQEGTVFLSEPASQGGGISDALSILLDSTGGGINIFFFSDPLTIPAVDISPNQFTIPETGNWQDVSSFFGQPHGFAQVISDVDAAVPEPGVWSMLILGMGALGGMLRSRRGTRPAA